VLHSSYVNNALHTLADRALGDLCVFPVIYSNQYASGAQGGDREDVVRLAGNAVISGSG